MWGWLLSCARSGVRARLRLSVVQLHAGRSLLHQRVNVLEALVLVFATAALQRLLASVLQAASFCMAGAAARPPRP